MDGLTRPVGELPSEVYWRRRLVSIAFLILGLLVAFYLLRSLYSSGADPAPGVSPSVTPSITPSASPSVSPSAGTSLAGVRSCGATDLAIVISATQHDWPAGTLPSFHADITQTSQTRCVLDTSTSAAELAVTSGADRVWSSLDCSTTPLLAADRILLEPSAKTTLTATWPRVRSDEQCSTSLPDPKPGTYHATITIDGALSDESIFALTP